jgi:hypothetical protein
MSHRVEFNFIYNEIVLTCEAEFRDDGKEPIELGLSVHYVDGGVVEDISRYLQASLPTLWGDLIEKANYEAALYLEGLSL